MKLDRTILRFLGFNTQGDLGPWTFYTSTSKGLVFYLKTPPDKPASYLQLHQRNQMRAAAVVWQTISQDLRDRWETAAKRAHLRITGYNLFTYFQFTRDEETINTIERLANLELLPITWDGAP